MNNEWNQKGLRAYCQDAEEMLRLIIVSLSLNHPCHVTSH